jgi:hypothetical protein
LYSDTLLIVAGEFIDLLFILVLEDGINLDAAIIKDKNVQRIGEPWPNQ